MKPVQSSSREWNSEVYHRLSGPQVSWGKRVISRLRLRGDEVVLDPGCGTGRLTAELLEALPQGRVIGIDLSQNMLNSAREYLARFAARVGLVACDLLHLPFKRVFDGIVSTAAFHWVLDHDQLFANLRGVLKSGGWLEAQCAAATLRRAGFIGVETSVEAAPTVLDDAAHYEEFVRNIILRRHLENLPTEKVRSEFIARMTEQAAKDDPPFLLDYWRLNLRGHAS
jgi:ubiquinone/menaquinone biosynthesis C-methylase UbiE